MLYGNLPGSNPWIKVKQPEKSPIQGRELDAFLVKEELVDTSQPLQRREKERKKRLEGDITSSYRLNTQ